MPGQSRITYYDRDGNEIRWTASAAYYDAEGRLVYVEGEPPDDDDFVNVDETDEPSPG